MRDHVDCGVRHFFGIGFQDRRAQTGVGTFFRGQQMILMWPWDPRQVRLD